MPLQIEHGLDCRLTRTLIGLNDGSLVSRDTPECVVTVTSLGLVYRMRMLGGALPVTSAVARSVAVVPG
jgi:hypothetical protein